MTAFQITENKNEPQQQSFYILSDYYAIGEDKCLYQIVHENDLSEELILTYKSEEGVVFNYAEDGNIIDEIIKEIPNALRGDKVNRAFFVNDAGKIDYTVYLGQMELSPSYIFVISEEDTLDAGDYDYEDQEEMLDDDNFIDYTYRSILEDTINSLF